MIIDQNLNKPIVGVYYIEGVEDGAKLGLTIKPNLVRRLFVRMFLGWKWYDVIKKN